MDRETRTWRRLALAGAFSTGLLVTRLVMLSRGDVRGLWAVFTGGMNAEGETWREEAERRLSAVETHLQHLPPERM